MLGAWLEGSRVHFRVWAPEIHTVDVVLERPGQALSHPLTKEKDGTFTGEHPAAKVGDVYRYRLNQDKLFPDPASRFQPQGVHGPSQIIDAQSFRWTDQLWNGIPVQDLIFYELHTGTFSPEGTFEGIQRRLTHFTELGITALELMPVADFAGQRNWGYDGVALFSPSRAYGTPDDLRRLVDAAHKAHIAVFMDVVYNHLGPDGNYTGAFSPYYVTNRYHTPWGYAMNFDGDHNERVREFFIENALHWLREYHMDGLRLDATHAILDASPHPFLAELTSRVRQAIVGREVALVAEDNRNLISLVKPVTAGGMGFDAVWSDDFHHQIRRMLAGDKDGYFMDFTDSVSDVGAILSQGWLYTGQDTPFFKGPHGTDPAGVSLEHFVFCIQNHDQVGNRALGERLHHQIASAAYRAASTLLMLAPELPLLFMGQEWASSTPFLYFTDHHDELGKAVTQGRRNEFKEFTGFLKKDIPDPQAPDTFLRSKLDWPDILKEPHESVWLLYRALVKLRRQELKPVTSSEDFGVSSIGDSALFIKRKSRDGRLILALLQMKGSGDVSTAGHPFLPKDLKEWELLLDTEETAYSESPKPPVIHLAEEPLIEFARPGAVILKEH